MYEAEERACEEDDGSCNDDDDDEYDINDDFLDDTPATHLMGDEEYDTEIVSHQILLSQQRKKQRLLLADTPGKRSRHTLFDRENSDRRQQFEGVECGDKQPLKNCDVAVAGNNDTDGVDVIRPLPRKTANDGKKKKLRKKDEKNLETAKRRLYVHPVHVTEKERERHVNLLLHSDDGKSHYSTITNFSALMNSQYSKYRKLTHYCYSCLRGYPAAQYIRDRKDNAALQRHIGKCRGVGEEKISVKYASSGSVLKFTNIHKQLEQPFVAFADFEALCVPQDVRDCATGLEEVSTGVLKLNVGDHVYILQSADSDRDVKEIIILESPLYEIRNISLPESVDDTELVYHVQRLQQDDEEEEKEAEEAETKKCHASQLLRKVYDCENCGQSYVRAHHRDEHAKNCMKIRSEEKKKTVEQGADEEKKLSPNEFVVEQQIGA